MVVFLKTNKDSEVIVLYASEYPPKRNIVYCNGNASEHACNE